MSCLPTSDETKSPFVRGFVIWFVFLQKYLLHWVWVIPHFVVKISKVILSVWKCYVSVTLKIFKTCCSNFAVSSKTYQLFKFLLDVFRSEMNRYSCNLVVCTCIFWDKAIQNGWGYKFSWTLINCIVSVLQGI